MLSQDQEDAGSNPCSVIKSAMLRKALANYLVSVSGLGKNNDVVSQTCLWAEHWFEFLICTTSVITLTYMCVISCWSVYFSHGTILVSVTCTANF